MRRAAAETGGPEMVEIHVEPSPGFEATRKKLKLFEAIGKEFEGKGWAPAAQVLTEVRAVPTCFPQVDRILRVGGWPTDRFTLIHGDSNGGKTAFGLGLLASFLALDHFGAFIDAEGTTPLTWARQLLGSLVDHPAFRMMQPSSYEGTVDAVRAWAETIGNAKAKGQIPVETTGLLLLDSIRKLVPKRLLEKLLKEGSEGSDEEPEDGKRKKKQPAGVDGMGGRAAMYKAALNSAWMDELTLLLRQCGVGMAVIGREYEDSDTGPMNFAGPDYKLGGGKALNFEASARVRIVKAGTVKDGERVVGERHRVELHKTKVGVKEEKIPVGYFHTSNGALVPVGFDRARDVLELAEEHGIVEQSGSWYSFCGERLGQGESAAVKRIATSSALLESIEGEVRKYFMPAQEGPENAPAAPRAAPAKTKPKAKRTPPKRGNGRRK